VLRAPTSCAQPFEKSDFFRKITDFEQKSKLSCGAVVFQNVQKKGNNDIFIDWLFCVASIEVEIK
jgi:hypothetical protein